MKKSTVIQIICCLLIFLFGYTGLSKLSNHHFFYSQLLLFPVLKYAAFFISWVLPVTEIAVAIFLIIPATRLYGLFASFILLILFTIYLSVMIITGLKLPCSCGGVVTYLTWKEHIIFNLFFLSASFTGMYFQKKITQHNVPGFISSTAHSN